MKIWIIIIMVWVERVTNLNDLSVFIFIEYFVSLLMFGLILLLYGLILLLLFALI